MACLTHRETNHCVKKMGHREGSYIESLSVNSPQDGKWAGIIDVCWLGGGILFDLDTSNNA